MLRVTIAFALIAAAVPLAAQTASPAAQYDHLRTLTQMDRDGAAPYHIKIDAQIYDLKGDPSETGTIEEWWASPTEYRIEINSGSIHEVVATGHPDQLAELSRTTYLLNQLFHDTVHPLPPLYTGAAVTSAKQLFEKADLTCLRLQTPLHMEAGPPTFCVDAGTENLRISQHDFEFVIRNKPGTFHGVSVALINSISYFGRDAINGKITTIERLNPSAPGTPALQPEPAATSSPDTAEKLSRKGSAGGHVRRSTPPIYPASARRAGIQGTVLIHAIITTDGKLRSPVVLASPDDALSQAALDAIRSWRCDPYRLNGKLTEVSTTIPVNFKLPQ
jgi:protein TonB